MRTPGESCVPVAEEASEEVAEEEFEKTPGKAFEARQGTGAGSDVSRDHPSAARCVLAYPIPSCRLRIHDVLCRALM